MAKTKEQKHIAFDQLSAAVKSSKSVVFASFQGLKIKESDELRNACKEQSVKYIVSKKTILGKALESAGYTVNTKVFDGGVAVIVAENDEMLPAQIVAKFAKAHAITKIFGGIFEGRTVDATSIMALATLPSKKQLLGQLVGTLNAPVSGFVNVLAGNIRGLVTVLDAVKNKKTA